MRLANYAFWFTQWLGKHRWPIGFICDFHPTAPVRIPSTPYMVNLIYSNWTSTSCHLVVNNKENWNKNQRGVCPIFLLFLGGRGPLGGGRPVTHWHSYPGLGIMHKRNWCHPKQSEQWLTLWWRPLLCRTGDRIRNSWDQHFRTLFAVTTWTLFYE